MPLCLSTARLPRLIPTMPTLRSRLCVETGGKVARPVKELKGFVKVALQPGETKTVEMTIDDRALSYYDEALKEAQRLGYAEADPSGDVEGFDTAGKVAILSTPVA